MLTKQLINLDSVSFLDQLPVRVNPLMTSVHLLKPICFSHTHSTTVKTAHAWWSITDVSWIIVITMW